MLHKPLIQRFIEEKIRNPNLLKSLLNYSDMILESKKKIANLEQRIKKLKSVRSEESQKCNINANFAAIQGNILTQIAEIDAQIQTILNQEREKKLERQKKSKLQQEEINNWKKKIQQEKVNFQQQKQQMNRNKNDKESQRKKLVKIIEEQEKKMETLKEKQGHLGRTKEKNNLVIVKIRNQKDINKQLNKKQIESLTIYKENMKKKLGLQSELKSKTEEKLNKFMQEIKLIVEDGQLKDIYDISMKYMSEYQLTESEIKKKHDSVETKDDDDGEVSITASELLKMEQKNPQLKSNRLDFKNISGIENESQLIQASKSYIKNSREDKGNLEEEIKNSDEMIERLIKEEGETDKFIGDLKAKLQQKQNQITSLSILRLGSRK